MSQNFETAVSRLNNLQAIEPLLSALRTMSMGAWQMTQKRLATLDRYKGNYDHIIGEIVPHLNGLKSDYHIPSNQTPVVADTIYLILGSERGLCGKFNETLAEEAVAWIEAQDVTSFQIWAAGKRMVHTLERMDISFLGENPFRLPS